MRPFGLIFAASFWASLSGLVLAQGPSAPQASAQQPNYQPGWPCTGRERSFDPAYAKVAEATGGHLVLLDRSEVRVWSTLYAGDSGHKSTIVRAAGKIDSYVDIPFWVDSSVESLFVVASLQCMQTIFLYDPQRSGVDAKSPGMLDDWFRAGRISTVPMPQAGSWVLRLLGTGQYSVAVQANSNARLGTVDRKGNTLSIWPGESTADPVFRLVNAAGEPIRTLALAQDPDSPGHYNGTFEPPTVSFRVQAEWRAANGEIVWRTDPRLMEPASPAAAPSK
ncbi:MAG TPA: hypothetical protein VGR73_18625 [Bryobacteraceae bacterium]|nr:hypothetical protein [Bryobacteraceae bacterium]